MGGVLGALRRTNGWERERMGGRVALGVQDVLGGLRQADGSGEG